MELVSPYVNSLTEINLPSLRSSTERIKKFGAKVREEAASLTNHVFERTKVIFTSDITGITGTSTQFYFPSESTLPLPESVIQLTMNDSQSTITSNCDLPQNGFNPLAQFANPDSPISLFINRSIKGGTGKYHRAVQQAEQSLTSWVQETFPEQERKLEPRQLRTSVQSLLAKLRKLNDNNNGVVFEAFSYLLSTSADRSNTNIDDAIVSAPKPELQTVLSTLAHSLQHLRHDDMSGKIADIKDIPKIKSNRQPRAERTNSRRFKNLALSLGLASIALAACSAGDGLPPLPPNPENCPRLNWAILSRLLLREFAGHALKSAGLVEEIYSDLSRAELVRLRYELEIGPGREVQKALEEHGLEVAPKEDGTFRVTAQAQYFGDELFPCDDSSPTPPARPPPLVPEKGEIRKRGNMPFGKALGPAAVLAAASAALLAAKARRAAYSKRGTA